MRVTWPHNGSSQPLQASNVMKVLDVEGRSTESVHPANWGASVRAVCTTSEFHPSFAGWQGIRLGVQCTEQTTVAVLQVDLYDLV